jgi:hypothetical protein
MSVDLVYSHIERIGAQPPHLRRMPRVRVAQIVTDYLAYGWSVNEMCRQHSYLSLAEAHAAMAYYFDHQEELDAEIRKEVQEAASALANAPHSPFMVRMKAKGLL